MRRALCAFAFCVAAAAPLHAQTGWNETPQIKALYEAAKKEGRVTVWGTHRREVDWIPASFAKLPAEENWKDVKANLPGKPVAASAVPKVFVSYQPAELILLTGEPTYSAVTGTQLFWVSNTESDVFRMGKTGTVYYLVTGRWFSAADFTGPWTFATPSP